MDDEHLSRRLRGIAFSGEPPMMSSAADDIRRGRRGLFRHRVMVAAGGVAAAALLATGAATLPGVLEANRSLEYADSNDTSFEYGEMSSDELDTAYTACMFADDTDSWANWTEVEPKFGIRAYVPPDWAWASWIVAQEGENHLVASLDGVTDHCYFTEYDLTDEQDHHLLAPVTQDGLEFGRHIPEVARVTVRVGDAPEQDAFMKDGFWFLAMQDDSDDDDIYADDGLDWSFAITHPGYVLRAYDESGQLMYDSSTDHEGTRCFVLPSGEYLPVDDDDAELDPQECQPAYEWGF
ncbi:hypothetical protein [Phytoactinopolyspora limicola]|uniref:hypothetical protein n=1 Tax=Phytoactinopolyspora limicola TaxID=2715536 RepID=UPI001408FBA5|nr:hypothetical protein [Phytoactinopolyspora limicola]